MKANTLNNTGNNQELFRASDALSWSLCKRRAWFDFHPPELGAEEPDRFAQLVMARGIEHEEDVLNAMGPYEIASDAAHTQALMAKGAPLIYQGTLVESDLGVICKPDFLRLDHGEYRAEDAKLSSSMDGKKAQLAQIGSYDIVLGSSLRARAIMPNEEVYELVEKDLRTANLFLAEMRELVDSEVRPSANYTASKCESCPYKATCVPEFEARGNLGLNYFVDSRALPELALRGIRTLADMAATTVEALDGVPYLKKEVRRKNAILQSRSLLEKRLFRLGPTDSAKGTAIHFDVETWPFGAEGKGTVYLWGFLAPPYGPDNYEYVWADESEPGGDRKGWMDFLKAVRDYLTRYPDCTFVHYTDFERHQIRLYSKRFDMESDPTVMSLLDNTELFFDIKKAVSDSLVLPLYGYGLKGICKNPELVNFQWELDESGSQWSVVRYADYLAADNGEEKERIRQELLGYNRDDVRATRAQEVWLDRLNIKGTQKRRIAF